MAEPLLARLTFFPIALALAASCASQPSGLIVAHHIGLIGGGCEEPQTTLGLRLEHRPDGVFRIYNAAGADIILYYDVAGSFGPSQMFVIRFRDGGGNMIAEREQDCGWWTPKQNHSSLITSDDQIRRDRLNIPAGGFVDIGGGVEAIVGGWSHGRGPVAGPCQAQVRLYGFAEPLSWDSVGAVAEWMPAPCPRTYIPPNPR